MPWILYSLYCRLGADPLSASVVEAVLSFGISQGFDEAWPVLGRLPGAQQHTNHGRVQQKHLNN